MHTWILWLALQAPLHTGIDVGTGMALQPDAYVATLAGHVGFRLADLGLRMQGGLGTDLYSTRLESYIRLGYPGGENFGLYALGGVTWWVRWPRGGFAKFCARTDLPCDGHRFESLAPQIGAGLRVWRVTGEVVAAGGDNPLYTGLVSARVWP